MNMTQKINYQIEISKDELSLITKALTGVLKERDMDSAKTLGIKILEGVNELSQERLKITEGALNRAIEILK